MTRHTVSSHPIEIVYGCDHVTGYFLSVKDKRLVRSSTASDKVNKIAVKAGNGELGGYFDLHTGFGGFGFKVDIPTLIVFLQRYGADPQHIAAIKNGQQF